MNAGKGGAGMVLFLLRATLDDAETTHRTRWFLTRHLRASRTDLGEYFYGRMQPRGLLRHFGNRTRSFAASFQRMK
jgi:hypothetical protein